MKKILFDEIDKNSIPKKNLNFKIRNLNILGGGNALFSKDAEYRLNHSNKVSGSIILLILVLFTFLLFGSRSFVFMVIQNSKYKELADQNSYRELLLQPERGVIYDTNGEFLVRNKPAFSLDLNTNICSLSYTNFSYCKSLVREINNIVPLDIARIFKDLDNEKDNIILTTGLAKEALLPIEARLSEFSGVSIITAPQRDYLYKDVFAHLIGYVGIGGESIPSIEGKMGVEKSYDQFISGSFGSKTVKVDAFGNTQRVLSEKLPIPGRDVKLYVDKDLQIKAYELLKDKIEKGEANAGVVVAQDPQTGGILAIVSYPAFDPQLMSSGIKPEELDALNKNPKFPFFDRAISAAYAPGSTFKMVVASAALDEGIVTEDTIINDPGYIKIGSFIFRNWKLDGHGDVDIRRAIQVSNDTYFYTLGGGYGDVRGLGIEKLAEWAKKFGFGSVSGIDLVGEVSGYIPDGTSRDWYLGDTYITAIGQGDVLATPLQTNNLTLYFANGGYLLKPKVVKSIDGEAENETEVLAQNLVSYKSYQVVREGMHMSVSPGGTGYPVFDFPQKHSGIELAGKTGTSEYTDPQGNAKTHAWFTVFGPYEENKSNATIAMTVFLEGGGGGSDDAAPIARELLDLWFDKESTK